MRPNQTNKNRQRGRNNNGGRKHVNPLSRNFESSGPDVKVRGNAAHVAEKYLQLARDAHSSGDPVLAENYLQHAEHYFRIVAAAQPQSQYRGSDQPDLAPEGDDEEDFPPVNDRFASPEITPRFQPQPQPSEMPASSVVVGEGTGEASNAPAPAGATSDEDGQVVEAADPRRHRERGRRRRRAPGGGELNDSPQPEAVELPAFLTGSNGAAG